MPNNPAPFRVTLLGTGTSTGVPVIGCTCPTCTSEDPRDQRLRCACYVEVDGLGLLIDVGPDFRQQALRSRLPRIDAVLFTHHHFDHVTGLDDLRPFFFRNPAPIPCFAPPNTAEVLQQMFRYIFVERTYPGISKLELHAIAPEPFCIPSRDDPSTTVAVRPLPAFHGQLPIYGYRIGRFAYLTDTSHLPEATFDQLTDLDVLVLDALRDSPHPTHFSFEEAVAAAQRIGARQTYFIHMTHSVLHAEANAALPPGVSLGYDGLAFEVAR